MTQVIYKYVLLNGSDSGADYDQPFTGGGCFEVRVHLPFNAHLLAVGLDPNDPRAFQDIVAWCIVDRAIVDKMVTEERRFYFAFTGGRWPERTHLASLSNGVTGAARVVHVFGGGIQ